MTASAFGIGFRIRRWWRRALVPHDHCGEASVTAQTLQAHHTTFSPIYIKIFLFSVYVGIFIIYVGIFSAPVVDINYSCCYHLGKLDYSGYVCSLQFFHLMNMLSKTLGKPLLNVATYLFPQATSWWPCWYGKDCASRDDSGQSQLNVKSSHKNYEALEVDLAEWWSLFFSLGTQMRALGLVKCRRLKTL